MNPSRSQAGRRSASPGTSESVSLSVRETPSSNVIRRNGNGLDASVQSHHLTLALYDEGVRDIPVSVVANMSEFSFGEFWTTLESRSWTHPFDDEGRRHLYDDMPTSVDDLIDDPFRSLAGAVKRAGGYAKDRSPFSEFRWADFLRCHIARELVERNFGRALALAMNLAQSTAAAALPGWLRHPEH